MSTKHDHNVGHLHKPEGEKKCVCVGKHVPLPNLLNAHHKVPKYYGGHDTDDNLVWLCPTTHVNVHALLREYDRNKGIPHGSIRKHYSMYVQDLAGYAWEHREVGEPDAPDS